MYKQKFNLRNVVAIAICLAVTTSMFFSCDLLSSEKQITSFSFAVPPAAGIINEGAKTIAVTVPAGTDVTALVPVITISSLATVSPGSGVPQNFTNPVAYTVTAEDASTAVYTVTVTIGNTPGGNPIELTSPIRENTTLTDLGLEVDYIYNGNGQLSVENNATLTIEPGVTIKFAASNRSGGIIVKSGATIQAKGTAGKHIRFIGINNEKGSWYGITLDAAFTDNQFVFCDFVNAGSSAHSEAAALNLGNAKAGISHCTFTRGIGCGLRLRSDAVNNCELSFFDNNVIEDYVSPVYIRAHPGLKLLEKFDTTSDFTKNEKQYIDIDPLMSSNVTLNQTTVPYYFDDHLVLKNVLTLNEGVTIYMKEGYNIGGSGAGRLMVNGTPTNKVKFTHMPDTYYYWGVVEFSLLGSVIKNCIFEYGGKFGTMIRLNSNTNLTLENVAFNNSNTFGVLITGLDCNHIINHSGVTFSNNKSGNVKDDCRGGVFPGLP